MSLSTGIDTVENVMTFAEASEVWGLSKTTLKNRCNRGGFGTYDLKEGRDYRKSSGIWLITDMAMRRLYGPPPKDILKAKIKAFVDDKLKACSNPGDIQQVQDVITEFAATKTYKEITEKFEDQVKEFMRFLVDYYVKRVNGGF